MILLLTDIIPKRLRNGSYINEYCVILKISITEAVWLRGSRKS